VLGPEGTPFAFLFGTSELDMRMFDTTKAKPDYSLLALVMALSIFGLVMVYSASFFVAVSEGQAQTHYLQRQFLWMGLGTVGLLFGMRIDYRVWKRFTMPLFGFSIILLLLVLMLPESMTSAGGARRWIRVGGQQFQPVELAKFALIVYLAAWLVGRGGDKLKSMGKGLVPFVLIVGLLCGIMYMQRNVSSAFMLIVIAVAIYFAAGANLAHIGLGMLGAAGVGWVFVTTLGHASVRWRMFLDPWADPRGGGFQPIHSLYALASGGVFGRGLGQGRQKFLWLYSPHADSIFAVIGEELGMLGAGLVVVAFVLLGYRGFRIAARTNNAFGALLAVGITSWITFQAFVNMAVVSSLIPYTGQTLPFVSYGGTSLAMCMFAMGVLLNVSKHVDDQRPEPLPSPVVPGSPPAKGRKRRKGLWPALAALVWRGNRRPRISGAHGRVGFARTARRADVVVDARGWRRLTSQGRAKHGATARSGGRASGKRAAGGTKSSAERRS